MKLLFELFFTFLKIGTFTFGGGYAMLPLIKKAVVEEKGWITDDEMVDCMALSQSLPGVLAVNTAIYIGNKKSRIMGSIAATFGVTLPAFVSIIIILLFLDRIEENTYMLGAFEGIKAASAALIAVAAYNLGKRILKGRFEILVAGISFIIIVFAGISAVWGIVFGGLAGIGSYWYRQKKGGIQ